MAEATVKVAFASTDRKHVDQHFGAAQAVAIYSVGPTQVTLVEFAQFGALDQDGHEDKLAAKLDVLAGCAAVYCQAVGGSAIRQLLNKNIQPIRVDEGASIARLLRELQAELRESPSAWLARALDRQNSPDAGRFDAMDAEGWQE